MELIAGFVTGTGSGLTPAARPAFSAGTTRELSNGVSPATDAGEELPAVFDLNATLNQAARATLPESPTRVGASV